MTKKIDELCVNTLRFLAVDAVEKANSGHPECPWGRGHGLRALDRVFTA